MWIVWWERGEIKRFEKERKQSGNEEKGENK